MILFILHQDILFEYTGKVRVLILYVFQILQVQYLVAYCFIENQSDAFGSDEVCIAVVEHQRRNTLGVVRKHVFLTHKK